MVARPMRSRSQNAGNPKLSSLVNSAFSVEDEIKGALHKVAEPNPEAYPRPGTVRAVDGVDECRREECYVGK